MTLYCILWHMLHTLSSCADATQSFQSPGVALHILLHFLVKLTSPFDWDVEITTLQSALKYWKRKSNL